jgi:excisionase family DNA binding protein
MDLLTVAEASKELGISREAVYLAIREGRLKAIKILGKHGIRRKEVEAYQPVEVKVRAGQKSAATKKRANRGRPKLKS